MDRYVDDLFIHLFLERIYISTSLDSILSLLAKVAGSDIFILGRSHKYYIHLRSYWQMMKRNKWTENVTLFIILID